ncbi:hypothetical protein AB0F52_10770 [Amycolatopsis sp. NPDC024027]
MAAGAGDAAKTTETAAVRGATLATRRMAPDLPRVRAGPVT